MLKIIKNQTKHISNTLSRELRRVQELKYHILFLKVTKSQEVFSFPTHQKKIPVRQFFKPDENLLEFVNFAHFAFLKWDENENSLCELATFISNKGSFNNYVSKTFSRPKTALNFHLTRFFQKK